MYFSYVEFNRDDAFFAVEKGEFLALDLGGSKFKVYQVKVREGMGFTRGGVEMEEETYPIPKELHIGRGSEVQMRTSRKSEKKIPGNQ